MKNFLLKYLVSITTFLILDIPWIILVVQPMYERELGDITRSEPLLLPAILFYLIITGAIVWITNKKPLFKASLLSFVVGFVSYSTYTLTNMAVIEGWTWKLVVSDILWGGTLALLTYLSSYYLLQKSEYTVNDEVIS